MSSSGTVITPFRKAKAQANVLKIYVFNDTLAFQHIVLYEIYIFSHFR